MEKRLLPGYYWIAELPAPSYEKDLWKKMKCLLSKEGTQPRYGTPVNNISNNGISVRCAMTTRRNNSISRRPGDSLTPHPPLTRFFSFTPSLPLFTISSSLIQFYLSARSWPHSLIPYIPNLLSLLPTMWDPTSATVSQQYTQSDFNFHGVTVRHLSSSTQPPHAISPQH